MVDRQYPIHKLNYNTLLKTINMPNYINNAENIYKYFSFYKILPLRELRRTLGVQFDEVQSIDIPN